MSRVGLNDICVCLSADCGVDPKSVHSGNGLPLLALRHLVSLPVMQYATSNNICKPLLVRVSLYVAVYKCRNL